MNIISVYVGYTTVDEYGRRGKIVGVYRNYRDAELGVKHEGWYGGRGRVLESKAIVDGDDLYILEEPSPLQFRDVTEQREAARKERVKALMQQFTKEDLEILKEELTKE